VDVFGKNRCYLSYFVMNMTVPARTLSSVCEVMAALGVSSRL
jgi:hypothetical protein